MRKGFITAMLWGMGVIAVGAASLLPPLPALPEVSGPIVGATSTAPPPLPAVERAPAVTVEETVESAWAVDGRVVEVTLRERVQTPPAVTEFTLWPAAELRRVMATDDARVWRLETDGLAPDTYYRVAYRGGETVGFRTLRTARETSDRYKGRLGDYF